ALVSAHPARRDGRPRAHRRRAGGRQAVAALRGVLAARARQGPRAPIREQRQEGAAPRALPSERAGRGRADGRGAPLGGFRGPGGRLRLLRHGGLVRLREGALRHLGLARQSAPGPGREGRDGRDGDRRARHLLPSADSAPGRSPGQAPGGGPARGPLALELAAAAVFVAAFVKGAIGFGFPTVGTPLLALVVDVKTAVPLLVVPNLVMDGFQFRRQGPVGDAPRRLLPLLVFTIVGTIIGTKLLVMLSPRAAALTLGVFVLGYVLLDLVRVTPRIPLGWERRIAPPVGLLAGIMGGITNAPGTA